MNPRSLVLTALLAGCATTPTPKPAPAATPAAAPVDPASAEARAGVESLAKDLASRQFAQATARFSEKLAKALSAENLGKQWDSMVGDLGAFQRTTVTKDGPGPDGDRLVFFTCEYERSGLRLVARLDPAGRVVGLSPDSTSRVEFLEAAREVVGLLVKGDATKVVARFDAQMREAYSLEALAKDLEKRSFERGAFQKILSAKSRPMPDGAVIDVDCAFEKVNAGFRLAFDERLLVRGLFYRPSWNPPAYADQTRFEEREVTIGTKALPLSGTLTLPKSKDPVPAVVLVHGSGPNDRDESSGPNKIFKDLAWGLAGRGVAVLRYEKRTEQYRGKLKNADIPTVKEESLDDTRTAVDLLLQTPGIDPKRIVVAGHSLGASLAPRIAKDDGRVRGIVLLAGATRTEGQIKNDQVRYLVGPWGASKEQAEKLIKEAEEIAKRLDGPDLKPDEIVDGIAGQYWLDLRVHSGVALAPQVSVPMLVLQGERDYQVTMVDFEGWKKALAGRKDVTFTSYPELNHHFMPGMGPSVPKEYDTPNHVPEQVIADVAGWVLGLK